jgi:hypothetical protein
MAVLETRIGLISSNESCADLPMAREESGKCSIIDLSLCFQAIFGRARPQFQISCDYGLAFDDTFGTN